MHGHMNVSQTDVTVLTYLVQTYRYKNFGIFSFVIPTNVHLICVLE
jgi:hypothetical protein